MEERIMSEVRSGWGRTLRGCLAPAVLAISALHAAPASAALAISIQQTTPNPLLTRSTVDYSVTLRNVGTIVAQQNIQVRVSFPGSLWGIPAGGVGTSCAFAGGGGAPTALITCAVGTLAGGATTAIAFRIMAPSRVADSQFQQFTITAGLDVNGALPGTGGADAIATVTTQVRALPDLDPDWSGPLTLTTGSEAAYALRLRNAGDGLATSALARITLPREVDFVRLEQSTFRSCPINGQQIDCSELVLPPGGEASVRIIVRPLRLVTEGTRVILSAGADPSGSVSESRENNNTAFIMPTVRAQADLAAGGTFRFRDYPAITNPLVRPIPICGIPSRGRHMVADVTIRNGGPGVSPATTLRVDWMGTNVRAVESDCATGSCCESGSCIARPEGCPAPNINSAPVRSLLPGAQTTIRVDAVADVPGFRENQVEWGSVTVDPDNRVNDPNRQNNRWTLRP